MAEFPFGKACETAFTGAHEAVREYTPLFDPVPSPVKARLPARRTQRYKGYVVIFAKNGQGDTKMEI